MAVSSVSREDSIIKDLLSLNDGNIDNLADVVTKGYSDVARIFGGEMALKMFVYFRGDTINCAMGFYKKDFVVDLAAKCEDKRERKRIAMICGYSLQTIEKAVREKRLSAN